MFASATKLWMFLRALQVIKKKIFLEETELFGKFVQPAVGTANLTLLFDWIACQPAVHVSPSLYTLLYLAPLTFI